MAQYLHVYNCFIRPVILAADLWQFDKLTSFRSRTDERSRALLTQPPSLY